MAREVEKACVNLLTDICGAPDPTPEWLIRPGETECQGQWEIVSGIYTGLTGLVLPTVMRRIERRTVDGVFRWGTRSFVFELDEKQHFNHFRKMTLLEYPVITQLAFDKQQWIARCDQKKGLERGGFAKPMPPLFPGENGRHKQRAFRDALSDLLPPAHGWLPTLRLADFEVASWIDGVGANARMGKLLEKRLDGQLEPDRPDSQ